MLKEKICGVYCIENLINKKRYIGQSRDIYKRWNFHKSSLNNKHHSNYDLQESWNKYGSDQFKFYVLEECKIKDLNVREKYWIEYYDTTKTGYNLTLGGDAPCLSKPCSDITKHKISQSKRGFVMTSEQKQRIKDGRKNSPNVLRGVNHPYFNKKLTKEEVDRLRNGLKKYYKNNDYAPPWSKSVICVTTGEVFNTIKKASQKYNVMNIGECCEHNREFAGELPDGTRLQWEWFEKGKKYIKKPQVRRSNAERPILQYDLDNNFIKEWPSAKVCCDNTGLQRSKVCCVCRGKRHQTGGFIFKYKETA